MYHHSLLPLMKLWRSRNHLTNCLKVKNAFHGVKFLQRPQERSVWHKNTGDEWY
jgi:hypothetical protein